MEKKKRENEFEWRQFTKLGEMMGDGLHFEDPSIAREYKRLSQILIPELKERNAAIRKSKRENVQKQMEELLAKRKCHCGGELKQKRKGAKVCYCTECNQRYVAR